MIPFYPVHGPGSLCVRYGVTEGQIRNGDAVV